MVRIAVRADRHLQKALLCRAARSALEDRHFPLFADFFDGGKARHILVGLVIIACACRCGIIRIVVRAEDRIVLTCDSEPHGLSGNILDAQPGLKDQGKIDDPKEDDQQDRQGQRKFHQCLGWAATQSARWRAVEFGRVQCDTVHGEYPYCEIRVAI